jgi:hypothetical protein
MENVITVKGTVEQVQAIARYAATLKIPLGQIEMCSRLEAKDILECTVVPVSLGKASDEQLEHSVVQVIETTIAPNYCYNIVILTDVRGVDNYYLYRHDGTIPIEELIKPLNGTAPHEFGSDLLPLNTLPRKRVVPGSVIKNLSLMVIQPEDDDRFYRFYFHVE